MIEARSSSAAVNTIVRVDNESKFASPNTAKPFFPWHSKVEQENIRLEFGQ